MRGELDDALARLRRWDEVRQRLAGEPVETRPEDSAPQGPIVPEPAPAPPQVPMSTPAASPPAARQTGASPSVTGSTSPLVPGPPGYLLPRALGGDILPPAVPTRPAGAIVPAHQGAARPTRSTGSAQVNQARPVAVAPAGDVSGPPGAVDDIVNAVASAMRRHRTLAVSVTIDDVSSSWTAQFMRGEDGQVLLARLEPYDVDASTGA